MLKMLVGNGIPKPTFGHCGVSQLAETYTMALVYLDRCARRPIRDLKLKIWVVRGFKLSNWPGPSFVADRIRP